METYMENSYDPSPEFLTSGQIASPQPLSLHSLKDGDTMSLSAFHLPVIVSPDEYCSPDEGLVQDILEASDELPEECARVTVVPATAAYRNERVTCMKGAAMVVAKSERGVIGGQNSRTSGRCEQQNRLRIHPFKNIS